MEARAAIWTFVGIFVVFKLATTAMMVAAAPHSAGTTVWLFIVFHWPFALGGLLLMAAPVLLWYRLVKVRAKRGQLEAAEWQVD